MLDSLFNRHQVTGKCYFFYSLEFNHTENENFFFEVKNYLEEKYGIRFSYMDYHGESYGMHYSKIETGIQKVRGKFEIQIHLSLYSGDIRKKECELRFEFDISRPVLLNIVVSNKFNFDMAQFCEKIGKWIDVFYGFGYNVDVNYYPTSFGIGDYERVLKLSGIRKSSKGDINRWNNNYALAKDGWFRDLFDENIINSNHLKAKINGLSLIEIIRKKELGQLNELTNGLFYWNLPANKLDIARRMIYDSQYII